MTAGLALSGCAAPPPEGTVTDYDQMMRLAARLEGSGDPVSAAGLYRQAAAANPEATEPVVALADLGRATGDHAGAAAAYEEAIKRGGGDTALRLNHARALLQAGRLDDAEMAYRAIVADDPTAALAFNGIGVTLDVRGRHGDAQAAYRRGLEQNFASIALRNNLALSLALSGQYDPAISGLAALSVNEEAPTRVRHNLALVYALAGHPAQAAAIERQELPPRDAKANLSFYEEMNELEGATLARAVFAAGVRSAASRDRSGRGRSGRDRSGRDQSGAR